ncbi:MAG: LysE family translocator [Polaromonas sp.]|nr:LysE family translocator [Polaromonas sp.]
MDQFAHLWLFFLMVLGIIILPGMDMAFVMASSLTGGRRYGLFAVGGIVAGGICHVVAGAFTRSTSVFGALPDVEGQSPWRTFRQAALTCLLNPKAYLFMLAIFPQFLRLEYGSLWMQAVALGLIIAVTQAGVYGSLALAAGGARQWLADRPGASVAMARTVGAVLILCAVFTAWQGWRQF